MTAIIGRSPAAAGLLAIVIVAGCGSSPTPSPSPSALPSSPPPSVAPASPSPEASASASPSARIYVVRKGDTLIAIAKANGITLAALRKANPQVTDPTKLRVGQKLVIPAP